MSMVARGPNASFTCFRQKGSSEPVHLMFVRKNAPRLLPSHRGEDSMELLSGEASNVSKGLLAPVILSVMPSGIRPIVILMCRNVWGS